MGKSKTIDCAECGKVIKLEDGMTEGFCLHCGTKFVVAKNEQIKNSDVDKFFSERNWTQLLQLTEDASEGKLAAYRALSKLGVSYQKYIKDAKELEKNTKPKAIFEMFIGRNSYASDNLHEEFRECVASFVDDLAAARKQMPDSDAVGSEACSIALEMMLGPKNREDAVYWPLTACEHLCIPLIPFVSMEKLIQLYSEYDRINPKNQMLPNQKNIKKVMTDEILSKGGEVPKKGRR